MTRNDSVYKTIWKNGNKEYNEKYICCFFTIWNLKRAITYRWRREVLFLTSVYLATTKLILLFSYTFHVPCIILSNVCFYILRSIFPYPFNWTQSKARVVNQMSHLFLKLKNTLWSFQLFENGHIHNVFSTLINVIKPDVKNNSIVSTLFNVVNINAEIDKLHLTLSDVATSYHLSNNVKTTLKCFLNINKCC